LIFDFFEKKPNNECISLPGANIAMVQMPVLYQFGFSPQYVIVYYLINNHLCANKKP